MFQHPHTAAPRRFFIVFTISFALLTGFFSG